MELAWNFLNHVERMEVEGEGEDRRTSARGWNESSPFGQQMLVLRPRIESGTRRAVGNRSSVGRDQVVWSYEAKKQEEDKVSFELLHFSSSFILDMWA